MIRLLAGLILFATPAAAIWTYKHKDVVIDVTVLSLEPVVLMCSNADCIRLEPKDARTLAAVLVAAADEASARKLK